MAGPFSISVTNAYALRQQLADKLKREGALRDAAVERAVRAVPRHFFSPATSLESAYEDHVLRLKDEGGIIVSTISQPAMIVEMLQQLRVREGNRILEIGTGSGYTTALLAALAGECGFVTTLDLEADLIADARVRFRELGIEVIRPFVRDGVLGDAEHAPYDRIVLTACASDIATAWWEQLRPGGRIVLPLSLGGVQKNIAFQETLRTLESDGIIDCGFLMLRGPGVPDERLERDRIRAHIEGAGETHALVGEYTQRDLYAGLMLWIALQDDRFCRLDRSEDPSPLVGLAANDSAAVLRIGETTRIARYGPSADLAERLGDLIAQWDAAGRPGRRGMHVTAVPAEAEIKKPPATTFTLRRPATTFFVSLH
jgi:protein-L-isoaspartate(D-aspartate) O-methyltransferase